MKGKFGRILGDFMTDEGDFITEVLIDEGHAVEYNGQSKEDIRDQHYKNRKRLISEGKVIVKESS
jgi:endonuclease YncB( thermonuclease family)